MRRVSPIVLAMLIAVFSFAVNAPRAEAHSRHGGGALAFGIAAAVIGGVALSRSHRQHRYYNNYYDDGYDYAPSYYSRRSYYRGGYYNGYSGGRSSYAIGGFGGGHGHHHRHH